MATLKNIYLGSTEIDPVTKQNVVIPKTVISGATQEEVNKNALLIKWGSQTGINPANLQFAETTPAPPALAPVSTGAAPGSASASTGAAGGYQPAPSAPVATATTTNNYTVPAGYTPPADFDKASVTAMLQRHGIANPTPAMIYAVQVNRLNSGNIGSFKSSVDEAYKKLGITPDSSIYESQLFTSAGKLKDGYNAWKNTLQAWATSKAGTGAQAGATASTNAQNLPPATNAATPAPTSINTLKAYGPDGSVVYVQPGKYYPGVSLTPPTTTPAGPSGPSTDSGQARAKKSNAEAKKILDEQNKVVDQTAEEADLARQVRIADLKKQLGIDTGIPAAPTLKTDFETLRSTNGLTDLETQMNSLKSQIRDAQESVTLGMQKQEGRLAPMELIGTRQLELQRQANEQVTTLNNRLQTLQDEYNTKLNIISQTMQYEQTDYANAVNSYNTKFTQAMQIQDALASEDDKAQAEKNVVRDDARANLTVIMNMVKDANMSFTDIDPVLQAQIKVLELKAGLPAGTTELFVSSKPGMEVMATTSGVDADGNQVVSFVYKDPKTGMAGTTQVVKTGTVSAATNGGYKFTNDDNGKLLTAGFTKEDIAFIQNDLNAGYTIEEVLNNKSITPQQKNTLSGILAGTTPQKSPVAVAASRYLSADWWKSSMESDSDMKEWIEDMAKANGLMKGGILGIGKTPDFDAEIDRIMNEIIKLRDMDPGASDDEIFNKIIKNKVI